MEQLKEILDKITYFHDGMGFPEKEFEFICANKEAAIPYLRNAIQKVGWEGTGVEPNYYLHIYAMYLLAQFQDRECFPDMMRLLCLPTDDLDYLIGDVLTEDANNILYNTYNGDMELLKQKISDPSTNEFARSAMLDVMGQLYLDQKLDRQEWRKFLHGLVHGDKMPGDYTYINLAELICKCHFIEMLPEIRQLFQEGWMNVFGAGSYDDYVDYMFEYKERDAVFCKSHIDAAETISRWAAFASSANERKNYPKNQDDISKMIRDVSRKLNKMEKAPNIKVGRNDPCPCGSGKKYKKCCMNKTQNSTELLESEEEQKKWLQDYPAMKPEDAEKSKGRIYLEDYYNQESIEIDKLLYLALHNRTGLSLLQREPADKAKQRKRLYLAKAFNKFREFIQKENIQSFSEYDGKYTIHFFCDDWIGILCELLQEKDEEGILPDVQEIRKKMQ